MKKKAFTDDQQLAKLFPTRAAWAAADAAADALPPTAPMTRYVDTWLTAYWKAGGRRKTFKD